MKRTITRFRRVAVVTALTALALTTTTALAGSGVGGVFNLGQSNSVDAQTTLTGNPGGGTPLFRVNAGGTSPGLSLTVNSGVAPFKVNSNTKVASLNADLLDGLDSTGLPYWKLGGNAGTTPGTNFWAQPITRRSS